MFDPDAITLSIHRIRSGHWVGRILVGDEEIGSVGGDTPQKVVDAARETGLFPDRVEFDAN